MLAQQNQEFMVEKITSITDYNVANGAYVYRVVVTNPVTGDVA